MDISTSGEGQELPADGRDRYASPIVVLAAVLLITVAAITLFFARMVIFPELFVKGQPAPADIFAANRYEYQGILYVFARNPEREKKIKQRYKGLIVSEDLPKNITDSIKEFFKGSGLDRILERGVCGQKLVEKHFPDMELDKLNFRIVSDGQYTENKPYTEEEAADELLKHLLTGFDKLHKREGNVEYQESREKLKKKLEAVFDGGNLDYKDAVESNKENGKTISENEAIVRKGNEVTTDILDRIKKYYQNENNRKFFRSQAVITMAVTAVIVLALLFLMRHTLLMEFRDVRLILVASITASLLLVLNFFFLFLLVKYKPFGGKIPGNIVSAFIPVSAVAVLAVAFFNDIQSFFIALLVSLFTSLMIVPDFDLMVFLRIGLVTLLTCRVIRRIDNARWLFFSASLLPFLGVVLVHLPCYLDLTKGFRECLDSRSLQCAGLAAISSYTGVFIGMAVLFIGESLFHLDTRTSLVVASFFTSATLKKLRAKAEGTYNHSRAVAEIARDAAELIHADYWRVYTGALYHDIGKIKDSDHFCENNPASSGEYDKKSPEEAAEILLKHVDDGLAYADKHHLGPFIHRAILTHHGRSAVGNFLQRARQEQAQNPGREVDESKFHYHGELPCSKEESIISLADCCEAAVRSLFQSPGAQVNAKEVRERIDSVCNGRWAAGELKQSELSCREIEKIKSSFTKSLLSIYHRRTPYTLKSSAGTGVGTGKE